MQQCARVLAKRRHFPSRGNLGARHPERLVGNLERTASIFHFGERAAVGDLRIAHDLGHRSVRRTGNAVCVQIGEAFFRRLIQEDEPIMKTIRFHDGLLIDADRALARFLQYVRRFPTARSAAE